MIRALIFDVDGTLAETEEAHRQAFNETFTAWGLDWHWTQADYRDLLKITGGKERIRTYQAALPIAPLTDADIARMHGEKTARYGEIIASGGLTLRPGVGELIAAARKAGLKLAVATTTNLPNVEALAQCCWRRPAREIFDVIAAGDEVAAKKPAPDVYVLALHRLGLPAADCLAFEDSENGLRAARGAGLRVLMTPSAYTDHEPHEGAAWRVPSLEAAHLPAELSGLPLP
ncbi:HAD superfamily hydrolase (TIGR01509 family) [Rhodovulum imhoffii]|uniref:HAD superfamily hydrolase (TIGR01509 family) n=1 Tax=Rhodovulum imhoffii TaxID=365340 RepID=A0A2T5BPR8_9RHOB|nr:HAD family hydrolase [Rhodovulum imhoffii]MBK5933085.1 phosphatase [Rhodovulum imhoffii]PTN01059.1 HAD superfamily hydrolase (TIGR01509 family) [Rhodovulum imhoffii]